MGEPLVIWRFSDGKRGHDNQSLGLVRALSHLTAAEIHELVGPGLRVALADLLLGRCGADKNLPDPDLLIGAGHATHLPLLAARRARGGRIVVLMRPSLPLPLFDLCLIPHHDGVGPRGNVVVTEGALNTLAASTRQEARRGLILVGGVSAHYAWNGTEVLGQIEQAIAGSPPVAWQITDSRRTPPTTSRALAALRRGEVEFKPWQETAPDWLSSELDRAAVVWVTADSVSMVYEALTAGAAVGLIELPARRGDRLAGGIRQLIEERRAVTFSDWRRGTRLQPPAPPLDEAGRCARLILGRWFAERRS